MAEKKSVILYCDAIEQWDMLTNEQAGMLIKALLQYGQNGERIQTDDGMLALAFSFMTAQIDRDSEKWEKKRERNAENYKRRKNSQHDSEDSEQFSQIQQNSDSDTVTVTDTVTDTVTEKENNKEKSAGKPQKHATEISEVVQHLNARAGTNYRPSSASTQRHLQARFAEGYTVADCKSVIDKKCNEWKGTEFEKFLRPETLFGSKFESYLNAQRHTRDRPEQPHGSIDMNDVASLINQF